MTKKHGGQGNAKASSVVDAQASATTDNHSSTGDQPRMLLEASCERILAKTHAAVKKKAESISNARMNSSNPDPSKAQQDADWFDAENPLCDRLDAIAHSMSLDIDVGESARPDGD